jgi:hypothetical protein
VLHKQLFKRGVAIWLLFSTKSSFLQGERTLNPRSLDEESFLSYEQKNECRASRLSAWPMSMTIPLLCIIFTFFVLYLSLCKKECFRAIAGISLEQNVEWSMKKTSYTVGSKKKAIKQS